MYQNYPNPFNPATTVGFRIQSSEFVTLRVYDLLGREVAALMNEVKEPGIYTVQWDATGIASGAYLYRLTASTSSGQAGSFAQTKKLVALK